MKNNIIIISIYSVALFLFSCSNSEQSENALGTNEYLCVSDFSEYGNLHNAFMDNMQNNYQGPDNESSSLNEFYEDLNRFHTEFAKTIISTSFDYDLFVKTMDKYKGLVVVDQFMSNAFTRINTRADDGYIDLEEFCLKDSFQIEDIPNLRTLADQMYKQNYLSGNAYKLLNDLIGIVSDNYLGLSSDAVFLE